MDDRKRSATQSVDDLAPPTKRQAVNGGSKSSADSLPWNEDLEVSLPYTLPLLVSTPERVPPCGYYLQSDKVYTQIYISSEGLPSFVTQLNSPKAAIGLRFHHLKCIHGAALSQHANA